MTDSNKFMGAGLLLLSCFFYGLHFLLFRDAHHIAIYLVGDIAFVFVEVLLVSMILHRVLSERDRKHRLEKLNIVIGSFFSESGKTLLQWFTAADPVISQYRKNLVAAHDWSSSEYRTAVNSAQTLPCTVEPDAEFLVRLKSHLEANHQFYLRLLENPTLLEHEAFTDTLQAVFHLREELHWRQDPGSLSKTDMDHLKGDIHRVYSSLLVQWLHYLQYLQRSYPYLYSLGIRTNPLQENCSAELR